MSVALDIIPLIIVVILLFLGYHRGLLRSVLGLCGSVIAALSAYLVSIPVAEWIFQTFLRSGAYNTVTNILSTLSQEQPANTLLHQVIAALPNNLSAFIPTQMVESIQMQWTNTIPTTEQIATTITDELIAPIATTTIQLITFLIVFVIFCIVVRVLMRVLKLVDRIPLIGNLNASLGLLAGGVEAILFLLLFTGLVALMIQLSANEWPLLNNQIVEKTIFFRFLYQMNPLILS